jgi:5-methylcytosine-specific restriction endonuclease McrA
MEAAMSLDDSQTLVLNADYRPVSYFPLSLWSWQDAVQAVFSDRVDVVAEYDLPIRSPSASLKLPSVVALRSYVALPHRPAFSRSNLFLRDQFRCQYCGGRFRSEELTFDHVVPRSRGGRDEHRHGLHGLQRRQGQPHGRRMRPAAAGDADGADGTAALREWSRLSASRAARKLARLSVLERRVGSGLSRWPRRGAGPSAVRSDAA